MELRNPGKRDIVLGAVVPNVQTEAAYRRDLAKAITNMSASYEYWLRAKYRRALDTNMAAGRLPDTERAQDADLPGQQLQGGGWQRLGHAAHGVTSVLPEPRE